MGNCSTDRAEAIYMNHTRQDIENHCIALIKLDHFEKRQPLLKKQALDDVNKIVQASIDIIRAKEEQMATEFAKEMKMVFEDERRMKKLRKKDKSIEEYIGLTSARVKFEKYKNQVDDKFEVIMGELEKNMEEIFSNAKEEMQNNLVSFENDDHLTQDDIDGFFYKWRITNREMVKQSIMDVEAFFRDNLTHDYFRNKLKRVVSPDQIKNLTKVKKHSAPKTASTSEVEIDIPELEEEPIITSDAKIQGCWCWAPKR